MTEKRKPMVRVTKKRLDNAKASQRAAWARITAEIEDLKAQLYRLKEDLRDQDEQSG